MEQAEPTGASEPDLGLAASRCVRWFLARRTDEALGANDFAASPTPLLTMTPESKVTAEHLKRAAYLYIRQSTLRQVLENTESTERQYALRRRALVLGWVEERIVVIDEDQGQSGASVKGREGFLRLVAEVGLGKAGIVMGLEVSRLARNCADWHRLLEICGLTHCLILDEDGLYDPGHYNDRLLLGLKRDDERSRVARAQIAADWGGAE